MKSVDPSLVYRAGRLVLWVLGVIIATLQLVACSTVTAGLGAAEEAALNQPAAIEDSLGIRVEGLRLSAAGSMLDFRYRVLDATKASPLLNGKTQVMLLDEARGAKLGVPESPVLGRIRQTARNNHIMTDRTYFIMFANPGKALQSGDKVSLLLGQTKMADLMVQ